MPWILIHFLNMTSYWSIYFSFWWWYTNQAKIIFTESIKNRFTLFRHNIQASWEYVTSLGVRYIYISPGSFWKMFMAKCAAKLAYYPDNMVRCFKFWRDIIMNQRPFAALRFSSTNCRILLWKYWTFSSTAESSFQKCKKYPQKLQLRTATFFFWGLKWNEIFLCKSSVKNLLKI